MNTTEEAIRFDCAGETLFGILAHPAHPGVPGASDSPAAPSDLGIVIVVGGPQTRVGSHRQFTLLSRTLAAAGFPVLRFDYRGMGDSSGEARDFEAVNLDIGAAINALQATRPHITRIVLWGLCDAAAAALLYFDDTHDQRIAGLCLLNPWVRSEATLAKTQVKHYYGQRLLQKAFWTKLLSGRLNIASAVAELLRKFGQASAKTEAGESLTFQDRMARGLRDFPGQVQLILSGNDYTAKEFLEFVAVSANWRGLLERPNLTRVDIAAADHTFSSQEWRKTVENTCLDWLNHYD
jgi:exosortase A-associated hydrolase 1